jgi:hypothetical protein
LFNWQSKMNVIREKMGKNKLLLDYLYIHEKWKGGNVLLLLYIYCVVYSGYSGGYSRKWERSIIICPSSLCLCLRVIRSRIRSYRHSPPSFSFYPLF